jgi:hypothetical protein
MVERWSKVGYEKRSDEAVPHPMSPSRGKRTGEDPPIHPPFPPPGWQKQGEIGNVLHVSKIASKVREVGYPLLKRGRLGML